MATLRGLEWGGVPVVVQVLGWDEAFLAAGVGHGELGDPRDFAEHVRAEVLAATRLHCSVGIGDNKLRAKIATDFGKPRGVSQLTADDWFEVMGERPTRALWGIGAKTAKKLSALGIDTVDQLARSDARVLAAELGPTMGPWFHRLGRGEDSSPVDASPWVPRAHGREETFQDRPGGARRDRRRRPPDHRAGARRHRRRGSPGGTGRAQGAVHAVLHAQPQPDPARADQRPGDPGRRGGVPARPARATTGRCGCSASAWR